MKTEIEQTSFSSIDPTSQAKVSSIETTDEKSMELVKRTGHGKALSASVPVTIRRVASQTRDGDTLPSQEIVLRNNRICSFTLVSQHDGQ